MNFDIGIPNIFQNTILFLGSLFLLDLLLATASSKISLSTGKLQYFLLNQIGKNSAGNFLISMVLRVFSFLEKAYFVQLKSWVSVGSFSMRQKFVVCSGGVLGASLLFGLFLLPLNDLFLSFGIFGCFLALFWRRRVQDFGFGILLLGFAFGLVHFLLKVQWPGEGLWIPWMIPLFGQLLLVVASYFLFRTLLPTLVLLSFFLFKTWMSPDHFVFFFAIINFSRFMAIVDFRLLKAKRLKFFWSFWAGNIFLQPFAYFFLLKFPLDRFIQYVGEASSWSTSFTTTLVAFVCFELSIVVVFLFWFLMASFLEESGGRPKNKLEPQKIFSTENRNEVYSVHFLIHLLRQEFVKFATLTHTIFKLGKEVDLGEDDTLYRFKKYCSIIPKVANELKSLCFSIGQQKTYSHQMTEVFSRYRLINQLELLVEDLEEVVGKIRPTEKPAGFRKDILRWFQNQLRVFEDFYFCAAGIEDPGMVASEEVRLEQVFSSLEELSDFFDEDSENWALLKTFHRMMDTNLGLRKNLNF